MALGWQRVGVCGLALGLGGGAVAQPVIEGTSAGVAARSGRLVLYGSGFGARGESSRVEVDGLTAWCSTWTGSRIVAYVPEQADPGPTGVRVVADGGASDSVPLEVTLREAAGRVRWTFEVDAKSMWFRPALAPDGTLYVHTSHGFVYAVAPDGGLRWIASAQWFPYVPPTAGPDGAVYCGSINTVFAISAQGLALWSFQDASAQGVHSAATVGPDGHLYGAFDLGLGAFSLTTGGDFRWNNWGDPPMFELGGEGNRTIFGPSRSGGPIDQVYIGMEREGDNYLYALDLAGNQRWAVPVGPNARGAEPTIGSDGTVYSTDFVRAAGWVIHALDPADGRTRWIFDGGFNSRVSDLAIAPDDTLYWSRDLAYLESFDPPSHSRNWSVNTGDVLGRPEITPDGSLLVVGGALGPGEAGFVRGYDAATGARLWNVDLPYEIYPGPSLIPVDSARITPDGSTAYVSTEQISGDDADEYALLYALDTEPNLDCDGDGVLDPDDNCECVHNPYQEDRDGDGIGDACDDFMLPDDCRDALELCPRVVTGNNHGATRDGETSCDPFFDQNRDVWYAYTPSADGSVAVSGCGSPFWFILSVHTGCPGEIGNQIGCDEGTCPTVAFDAEAGHTYLIRVTGNADNEIEYQLTLTGPDCTVGCAADFNGDGVVDTRDVLAFLSTWSSQGQGSDFNADGLVDSRDVLAFFNTWNDGCP